MNTGNYGFKSNNSSRPANAAGFPIHNVVHRSRLDMVAARHTHSPYGMAWSEIPTTRGRVIPRTVVRQRKSVLHMRQGGVLPRTVVRQRKSVFPHA